MHGIGPAACDQALKPVPGCDAGASPQRGKEACAKRGRSTWTLLKSYVVP